MQPAPHLPADKSAARPAPSPARPDHQQRDAGGNQHLRVAPDPAGAFDGAICCIEDGRKPCGKLAKVLAQMLAGELQPLLS